MPTTRLSALDASFLAVESPSAHMHVGWAATFAPPRRRPAPELRGAVRPHRGRLGRAPRYRQRLAPDAARGSTRRCGSTPRTSTLPSTSTARPPSASRTSPTPCCPSRCARDRPLWEFWIATELADGRIGARRQGPPLHGRRHRRGRARHRCCSTSSRSPAPRRAGRLAPRARPRTRSSCWPAASGTAAREQLGSCCAAPLQLARRPDLAARASRSAPAARWPAPCSRSPRRARSTGRARRDRHLATARRPLAELRAIRTHHGVTVNDVVLAAVAGALRRPAERRAGAPARPQGDGAGQRARGRRRRARQPHHVHVRRAAASTSRPARRGCGASTRPRPRTRKEARVPEDADAAMQALALRAAHGAAGGRARARQPARLQPRRLQHPRPADPDVPARLPAARGLSGGAAVRPPRGSRSA